MNLTVINCDSLPCKDSVTEGGDLYGHGHVNADDSGVDPVIGRDANILSLGTETCHQSATCGTDKAPFVSLYCWNVPPHCLHVSRFTCLISLPYLGTRVCKTTRKILL